MNKYKDLAKRYLVPETEVRRLAKTLSDTGLRKKAIWAEIERRLHRGCCEEKAYFCFTDAERRDIEARVGAKVIDLVGGPLDGGHVVTLPEAVELTFVDSETGRRLRYLRTLTNDTLSPQAEFVSYDPAPPPDRPVPPR